MNAGHTGNYIIGSPAQIILRNPRYEVAPTEDEEEEGSEGESEEDEETLFYGKEEEKKKEESENAEPSAVGWVTVKTLKIQTPVLVVFTETWYLGFFCTLSYLSQIMSKPVLYHMRTTTTEISLCILAVWSASLLFAV